jgi:YebC/PmpR family DNA-binding regulatory protein
MIVVKAGGGDPDKNASLRTALQKAKSSNMPTENIERAIKKGTGEIAGAALEEVVYEGYAAGGIGLVVNVLTDNKNRAAAEIRHCFGRHGSSFAGQGSVSRGFERRGQIFVDASKVKEDDLMAIVLDAGADDMTHDGDQFEVLTQPGAFAAVSLALEKAGIPVLSGEVSLVATAPIPVAEVSVARSVFKFVEDLEDNDDVQNVYHNMDVDDAVMDELEK